MTSCTTSFDASTTESKLFSQLDAKGMSSVAERCVAFKRECGWSDTAPTSEYVYRCNCLFLSESSPSAEFSGIEVRR